MGETLREVKNTGFQYVLSLLTDFRDVSWARRGCGISLVRATVPPIAVPDPSNSLETKARPTEDHGNNQLLALYGDVTTVVWLSKPDGHQLWWVVSTRCPQTDRKNVRRRERW